MTFKYADQEIELKTSGKELMTENDLPPGRIEPELVALLEEIVARRVREEMEARANLVTIDQFTAAMERIDQRFEESNQRFNQIETSFQEVLGKLDGIGAQLGVPLHHSSS